MKISAAVFVLAWSLVSMPGTVDAEVLWTPRPMTVGAVVLAGLEKVRGLATDPSLEDLAAAVHTDVLSPAALVAGHLSVDDTPSGPLTAILVGAKVVPGGADPALWRAASAPAADGTVETAPSDLGPVVGTGLAALLAVVLGTALLAGRQRGAAY